MLGSRAAERPSVRCCIRAHRQPPSTGSCRSRRPAPFLSPEGLRRREPCGSRSRPPSHRRVRIALLLKLAVQLRPHVQVHAVDAGREIGARNAGGIVTPRRTCGPSDDPIASGMEKISYAGYRFPPEIIDRAIWLYLRFTLSLRDVEDLLAERGVAVSYETVRRWVNHFGPMIAADLRKRRLKPHTTWHLDEVYLKIDGRMVYLWRAVDAEGEVVKAWICWKLGAGLTGPAA